MWKYDSCGKKIFELFSLMCRRRKSFMWQTWTKTMLKYEYLFMVKGATFSFDWHRKKYSDV